MKRLFFNCPRCKAKALRMGIYSWNGKSGDLMCMKCDMIYDSDILRRLGKLHK